MTENNERDFLKRRTFLRGAILAAAGSVMGVGFFLFRDKILGKRNPRDKPNIIFILADDMGRGDLGSYGQQLIRTPHLDNMAAEGIRFTDYYAGAPICAPSRGSLMTGLHTGHARIRANVTRAGDRVPLRPEDFTVAELLKDAGYVTGAFGKWGLGDPETSGMPTRQGFDAWFGFLNQEDAHAHYPEILWRGEEEIRIEENRDGRKQVYANDLFTQEALNFIETNRRRPFFLYLPYTLPHQDSELKKILGSGYEVPSDEPYTDQPWSQPDKNYAAMITRMDEDIGDILALLKRLELDDNTIVFFSSDNGPVEGGTSRKFFKSAGPFRGTKRQLYDGGIRVPMIVRWPRMIEAGTVSNQLSAFWDFLPTVADIVGGELPHDVESDGISILPALLTEAQQDREFLYWEYNRYRKKALEQAVRMGDWKGIRFSADSEVELYNLRDDVGEQHNVAAEHAEIVAEIVQIMDRENVPSPEFGL